MRHKCDMQSLSYGPLVPSRGWDHQMELGSIITGAALCLLPRPPPVSAQRPLGRMQAAVPGVGKGSPGCFLEARLLAREDCPHIA